MRVLVIAAVVTASLPGVAQATVELPVEFGEMVRDSQLVVHGRVVDVRSQQTGDRRSIETVVTMAVTEALKGRPGGDVTFRMPGGEVGRYRRVIVGRAAIRAGRRSGGLPAGRSAGAAHRVRPRSGPLRVGARAGRPRDRGPGPDAAPASGSRRVVRGDPARRPLALETFVRDVRARAGAQP